MRLLMGIAAVAILAAVGSTAANAVETLRLVRSQLINSPDAAGAWQFESGAAYKGTAHVADYYITRRFNSGAITTNSGSMTLTLLYIGRHPPSNMTMQGAHDFTTGGETGSVSAASGTYAGHIGKQFKSVPAGVAGTSTLTVN